MSHVPLLLFEDEAQDHEVLNIKDMGKQRQLSFALLSAISCNSSMEFIILAVQLRRNNISVGKLDGSFRSSHLDKSTRVNLLPFVLAFVISREHQATVARKIRCADDIVRWELLTV